VYPGINIGAYEKAVPHTEEQLGPIFEYEIRRYSVYVIMLTPCGEQHPRLPKYRLPHRIEGKKSLGRPIEAFAKVRQIIGSNRWERPLKLVIAGEESPVPLHRAPKRYCSTGGFDPRLVNNVHTLTKLLELCATLELSSFIATTNDLPPSLSRLREYHSQSHASSNVTFLLNFTTAQRTALLHSKNTLALVYTPTNEHFGIGPVEGMVCGVPVVACESGGPMESIIPFPAEPESIDINALDPRPSAFLAAPTSGAFSNALLRILRLPPKQREALSQAARMRAKQNFGMDTMCSGLEKVLQEAVAMGKMKGLLEEQGLSQIIFEGIGGEIIFLAVLA